MEPVQNSLVIDVEEKRDSYHASPLAFKSIGAEPSKVDRMFGITDEHKHRWNDWLVNNGAKMLFVLIIFALNVIVIAERLHCEYTEIFVSLPDYISGEGKKYTDVIGYGIPIARASAAGIKVDSGIILICVLRNFLSWYIFFCHC